MFNSNQVDLQENIVFSVLHMHFLVNLR
jgi:hypothetical protein